MIRSGKIVALALAVVMAASLVASTLPCRHMFHLGHKNMAACSMASMPPLASLTDAKVLPCCQISPATPVSTPTINGSGEGSVALTVRTVSTAVLQFPAAELDLSIHTAPQCPSSLQARLCPFLI